MTSFGFVPGSERNRVSSTAMSVLDKADPDEEPVVLVEEVNDIKEGFLVRIIRPNLDLFVGWAFFASLFIKGGWAGPNSFEHIIEPFLVYLLPIIVGYTSGRIIISSERGGTIGAFATMGAISATDSTMVIGGLTISPLITGLLALLDMPIEWVTRKINNTIFSPVVEFIKHASFILVCIVGALLGFVITGPLVDWIIGAFDDAVFVVGDIWLPFTAIFIDTGKALFIGEDLLSKNTTTIGISRASFLMVHSNPGPGLGLLFAFLFQGPVLARVTIPLSLILHFIGGIQSLYSFYILMKPFTLFAVIISSMCGAIIFDLGEVFLVNKPIPSSIMRITDYVPGDKLALMWIGIIVSSFVSFFITYYTLKGVSLRNKIYKVGEKIKSLSNNKK